MRGGQFHLEDAGLLEPSACKGWGLFFVLGILGGAHALPLACLGHILPGSLLPGTSDRNRLRRAGQWGAVASLTLGVAAP